jgi:hypothetical protein
MCNVGSDADIIDMLRAKWRRQLLSRVRNITRRRAICVSLECDHMLARRKLRAQTPSQNGMARNKDEHSIFQYRCGMRVDIGFVRSQGSTGHAIPSPSGPDANWWHNHVWAARKSAQIDQRAVQSDNRALIPFKSWLNYHNHEHDKVVQGSQESEAVKKRTLYWCRTPRTRHSKAINSVSCPAKISLCPCPPSCCSKARTSQGKVRHFAALRVPSRRRDLAELQCPLILKLTVQTYQAQRVALGCEPAAKRVSPLCRCSVWALLLNIAVRPHQKQASSSSTSVRGKLFH